MQSSRRKISWSKLPLELLRSIAKFLDNNSNDFTNFRAVCKSWRHSTSISILLPFCDYSTPSYNLFSSFVILIRSVDSSSSSTPWMVSLVEITKGNIQLCHPFFRTNLPNLPSNLDVSQVHSSLLTVSYHIGVLDDHNCLSALSSVDKVLVFSTRPLPCINDCLLLVLHNGRLGGYPCFKVIDDEPHWVDVSYHGVDDFDDIVNFRGVIYAVDWEGKLYEMATDKVAVQKTLVSAPISSAGAYKGWRKRLVGSSSDQKLYLIVRDQKDMLKIYKLLKHGKIWIWANVQSFDDDDQVLFLSRVYGFFAAAREFPGRKLHNCIVFSDDAFPIYSFRGWVYHTDAKAEEDIQIFRLGTHDDCSNFRPILSNPNFPIMLWTPPAWMSEGCTSRFQSHSDRRDSEDVEMQLDREPPAVMSPRKSAALNTETLVDPIVQTKSVNPHEVVQPIVNKVTTLKFQGVKNHEVVQPVVKEVTTLKLQGANIHEVIQPGLNEVTALKFRGANIHEVIQPGLNKVTTLKIQGANIQSEHLPILEKVWMKHGDIVNASNIRSCDIKSVALASLAKMILILQTNSGNTLTDDQAHYMASTLSDLQSMRMKVDWLVPSVEKALALHKRKPLEAALAELEKAKAKVEEINRKFLKEMAEMKQGFNQDKTQLDSESMSGSVSINPDTCLGEGLF